MVKTENTLKVENEELAKSSALIPLNMENKEFEMLMSLYENAKNDIVQKLTIIQEYLTEHKIKYKKKYELSSKDSKKMKIYSKILNIIDDNIMKIYEKQLEGKIGK